MKALTTIVLAALTLSSLSAQADPFRVGGMSGKESDLLYAAQKVAKERYGLDVEVVEFSDYFTPNAALDEGSIDANAYQHEPGLRAIMESRNFDFVPVGNTFVYPIGAYSHTIKSIDELKDGATIAIPNDPSNSARTLILMHEHGLIKVKDPSNLTLSVLDITENPHNYDIKEVDAAQLPRVLDEVDMAFINSNYAVDAGLQPTKDAVLRESEQSPYVNIIVVRTEDADKDEVKKFVQAYQSDEVEQAADAAFKGAAVKGW
ncbi:MetQ/NlpA family ABC transporter substrate-binding protein [Cardiobacteriaceae bacterium TAE3-ERU3]|nr:MetQ/NlpA family ABC transporter substrate-binding protein [Cardiobacteriaceae bacterium TAE3-ERU3]